MEQLPTAASEEPTPQQFYMEGLQPMESPGWSRQKGEQEGDAGRNCCELTIPLQPSVPLKWTVKELGVELSLRKAGKKSLVLMMYVFFYFVLFCFDFFFPPRKLVVTCLF